MQSGIQKLVHHKRGNSGTIFLRLENQLRSVRALHKSTPQVGCGFLEEMKITLIFAWYDFWVGLFWDAGKKRLYFLPVPMFGIRIDFVRKTD